jgi:hypothetical protein
MFGILDGAENVLTADRRVAQIDDRGLRGGNYPGGAGVLWGRRFRVNRLWEMDHVKSCAVRSP